MASLRSSDGRVKVLRTGDRWYESPTRLIFFPRTDDSHCNMIHFSLTAVYCFEDGDVGKQTVAGTNMNLAVYGNGLGGVMTSCMMLTAS